MEAAEQTVSKAGTGKGFHPLHKTGKGPALSVPGGRGEKNEEDMGLSPDQARAGNGVWMKTNSSLAAGSKEFWFNF